MPKRKRMPTKSKKERLVVEEKEENITKIEKLKKSSKSKGLIEESENEQLKEINETISQINVLKQSPKQNKNQFVDIEEEKIRKKEKTKKSTKESENEQLKETNETIPQIDVSPKHNKNQPVEIEEKKEENIEKKSTKKGKNKQFNKTKALPQIDVSPKHNKNQPVERKEKKEKKENIEKKSTKDENNQSNDPNEALLPEISLLLKQLSPKPKFGDPLTEAEKLLLKTPLHTSTPGVIGLFIKLGLINKDPTAVFTASFDNMGIGDLDTKRDRFYQVKNAFFRGRTGQGRQSPDPQYHVGNPGPNWCEYVDAVFLFEFEVYLKGIWWVGELPVGSPICSILLPILEGEAPYSGICELQLTA